MATIGRTLAAILLSVLTASAWGQSTQRTPDPQSATQTGQIANVVLNSSEKLLNRLIASSALADLSGAVYGGRAPNGQWRLVDFKEDLRTGFKAGLYEFISTGDLVVAFAGTEIDLPRLQSQLSRRFLEPLFLRSIAAPASSLIPPVLALAHCTLHPIVCRELWDYFQSAKADSFIAIGPILESISNVPAGEILMDPVASDNLRLLVNVAMGEPDVQTDIGLAFPELSAQAETAFLQAANWLEKWRLTFGQGRKGGIVALTGHSLGGSLAQVASLRHGIPAVTFNSAPLPLDPDFRRRIGFDTSKLRSPNIVNIRANDDPLTEVVFKIQEDPKVKRFLMEFMEGLFVQRGNTLDTVRKARYELGINGNWFYSGQWLVAPSATNHGIRGLARYLARLQANEASAHPRLSANGLGNATIGMTAQQVMQSLGVSLDMDARMRKNWGVAECSVSASTLPGSTFVFDRGQLAAVVLAAPSALRTREGIGVGDNERNAIDAYRTGRTYSRYVGRYDDGSGSSTEITVGVSAFNPSRNKWEGSLLKIRSRKGKITAIEAGLASYVAMDEHDWDNCQPGP
jgi:pimeloyl-ACP methyl ester carboxylesterase